jgi:hypothetical protein
MKRHKKTEWSQIEQALNALKKQELIQLVQQLYDLSDEVSRFVTVRFSSEKVREKQVARYCTVIEQQFLFHHDLLPDFGLITKTINEYRLATGDIVGVLALQLYGLETATAFVNQIGVHDSLFYEALADLLTDFTDLLGQHPEHYSQFASRIRQVSQKTGDVGYGYGDFAVARFAEIEDFLDGA